MSKFSSHQERSNKRRKLSPVSERTDTIRSERAKPENSNADKVAPKSYNHDQNINEGSKSITLPSVKDLASSEASKRRAALKNMLNYFTQREAQSTLSMTECLQVWRGFFVAIYMHDSKNTISVQNVLREVASTFQIFDSKDMELQQTRPKGKPDDTVTNHSWLAQYHAAFWQTLVKEWAGIDSHRMNKYLLLVRFVVKELASLCLRPLFKVQAPSNESSSNSKTRKRKTKAETETEFKVTVSSEDQMRVENVTKVLEADGPLNTIDRKIPDGLRLHILDLYAMEIFAAFSSLVEETEISDAATWSGSTAVQETLTMLKSPVSRMTDSANGAPKNVRTKAKEALADFESRNDELQALS